MRGLPCALFIVLAASAHTAAAQPAPPRDRQLPTADLPSAAVIKGRITASNGGQPLPRVRIVLSGGAAPPAPVVTDVEGAFELDDVPPGTYLIAASRNGFLPAQYGEPRPGEAGRRVEIKAGETLDHIDISLAAASVLAGRVVDELGEAHPGARVEALSMQFTRGRRLPLAATTATANDLGEFRLTGLAPGTYYIAATATETWQDVDARKDAHAYMYTYYPGAVAVDEAQSVPLAVGQDVEGLEVLLVPGRAATVSGVVLTAAGEPAALQAVNLDRITRNVGGALLSASMGGTGRTDREGRFQIRDIPPGEYNLYYGSAQTENAQLPVFVTGSDITGLVLTARKATALRGTVTTEDGGRPPFSVAALRIAPISTDAATILPPWGGPTPQPVGADGSFRFANITGSYVFRATGLPDGWMLKSVTAGGREVTDAPLDIAPGTAEIGDVHIALARGGGRVSGDVVTASGTPAADAYVIVFPQDDRLWNVGTRHVKAVRPDKAGHFSIAGLPPGSYFIATRTVVADGQWEDRVFLRALVDDASRLALADDREAVVPLVVKEESR